MLLITGLAAIATDFFLAYERCSLFSTPTRNEVCHNPLEGLPHSLENGDLVGQSGAPILSPSCRSNIRCRLVPVDLPFHFCDGLCHLIDHSLLIPRTCCKSDLPDRWTRLELSWDSRSATSPVDSTFDSISLTMR
jgi:hypothetical protein